MKKMNLKKYGWVLWALLFVLVAVYVIWQMFIR